MHTKYFDVLNNFVGFGNPKGKIWFVGLEEAFEWNENPHIDKNKYKLYKRGSFGFEKKDWDNWQANTKVYEVISKILLKLRKSNLDHRNYMKNNLLTDNSNEFFTNLFLQ